MNGGWGNQGEASLEVGEGQGGYSRPKRHTDVAGMDDVSLSCNPIQVTLEHPDGVGHARARRRGQLHFDGDETGACINDEINFQSRQSSPEIDLRIDPAVGQRPDDFGQNGRFKQSAAHGSGGRMLRILETDQVAQRADVREIDFRGFDEPFPDVREVGPQDDYLIGGLKYGQPGFDGIDRDSEIASHVGQPK